MSEIETGGPAFPSPNNVIAGDFVTGGHAGLTLRDYFAAKSMSALADPNVEVTDRMQFAAWCYSMADAMLKAREA